MTVALANALRKGWFAYTNNEKGNNYTRADRLERKITSYCQDIAATDEAIKVVKETTKGSQYVNALTNTLNASKSTSKLLEWAGKGANYASKAVNPILCVASGARVLAAEDKKSALLQEVGAMGGMFAIEGLIKHNLGLNGKAAAYVNNKTLNGIAKGIKTFAATNKFLKHIPTNRLTGILKAAIFVIGSCTGFALGGKLGKTIADNTTAKDFQMKKMLAEQAKIKELNTSNLGQNKDIIG